jgi:RimJ/RimL family protein N-acetyltransferase
MELPILLNGRVRLRPFHQDDAPRVATLANDERIASTLLVLPFPYYLEHATSWIARHEDDYAANRELNLAITIAATGELVGSIGMGFEPLHNRVLLGYWVGHEFWGQGFATSAAKAMTKFALDEKGINRVWAYHFVGNDASGKVLMNAGMRREGVIRGMVRKADRYIDCVMYGLVRGDPLPPP